MYNVEKKEKKAVRLFGVDYELSEINFGEAVLLSGFDANELEKSAETMKKVLIDKGLPEDAIFKMSIEDVSGLIEYLSSSKKK
jgi:hypothetical protein